MLASEPQSMVTGQNRRSVLLTNHLLSNSDPSLDDNLEETNDLAPEEEVSWDYAHSAVLPDGTVAELIRDPESPEHTLFACYKNGAISYADQLSVADEDILPTPLRGTLKRLRLPHRAEPPGSLKTLVFSISDLIQR